MSKIISEPETGAKPGVYTIEDVNGETKYLVAQNFPQADAFVRMNATYVQSIEEWKAEQIAKLKSEPKEDSDKKGK